MKKVLITVLLSLLCAMAMTGCSKEPKTNPTEPVNMAGALFILEKDELPVGKEYVNEVTEIFSPKDVETIVRDRLAESNFLSDSQNFTGTHPYQLLVGESFLSEAVAPSYVYLWIPDLNVLKKIYLIQGQLCDFNPMASMDTECLDEAAGVLYEGSFTFEADTTCNYASKEDFAPLYQGFDKIIRDEVPLLASESPSFITVYVMQGFAWELKAGSIQAYAGIRYESEKLDLYEIHLSYDEDGQAHMESLRIGNSLEDFPGIQKQLLYEYTIP